MQGLMMDVPLLVTSMTEYAGECHSSREVADRSKDVIRSGGEWISSVELENVAMGHEEIAEAAVIAAHHQKCRKGQC